MANSQVTIRDTQLEKQRIGFLRLSMTNFDNTSEPAIDGGSVVEIGGSLVVFSSNEAITGWGGVANDTDCYIKLVPGVGLVTAEFVEEPPTWSDGKQGWYDGIHRYVAGLHKGAGAGDYEDKWIYRCSQDDNADHRFLGTGVVEFDSGIVADVTGDVTGDLTGGIIDPGPDGFLMLSKILPTGVWDMDVSASVSIAHGIASGATEILFAECSVFIAAGGGGDSLMGGGRIQWDNTNVIPVRDTDGRFDAAPWAGTTPNPRGYVRIWYRV